MTSGMTPLMRQYHDIKARFEQEIILFQVGDFYEIFYDDAHKAAASLGIVLTQRGTNNGEPIPLCGFPRHAVDTYLIKLIQAGFRVVLCDQVTTAETGKLIERVVSSVLTPGTLTDSKLLDEKSASYLCALVETAQTYGLVFVEVLSGKMFATLTQHTNKKLLEAELNRFMPSEVIIAPQPELEQFLRSTGYVTTSIRASQEHAQLFSAWMQSSLEQATQTIVEHSFALKTCLQLIYAFLAKNNPVMLQQLQQFQMYTSEEYLLLDAATQRNLELIKNCDGTRSHTLFSVLDGAVTPMGSRTIKTWLLQPLTNRQQIEKRLTYVQALVDATSRREQVHTLLRTVGDVERIVGRIALQRASLPDYLAIQSFLSCLPELSKLVTQLAFHEMVQRIAACAEHYPQLAQLLATSLYDGSERAWSIKAGYHAELDRLRALVDSGSQAVLALEQQEQQATGISSLKIRFSSAHGYGIEITKPHLHLVPQHYQRLQTLVNRERFTTAQLRELEYDIERAQTDSLRIEKELFTQLCAEVQRYVPILRSLVQLVAELDAYAGFARVAAEQQYVKPVFTENQDLIIKQGRHPVVEAKMRSSGQGQFIANDIALTAAERLWIITGPNMGGKSTFLRQTALAVIMAQAGSFVPATFAQMPIFDRIFTRIGAADNVAQGKSTFFVEMEETALICNQATERSLVILDEVGRGTSTYDGLAIAQAVVEYIYAHIKARCLFATHYHELTELSKEHAGIVSYHAASRKTLDGIVFLHQIKKGCAQGSFGIEVAKSAQIPPAVVERAQVILANLTQRELVLPQQIKLQVPDTQVQNFIPPQVIQTLRELDLDAISPRQAFDVVGVLKEMILKEGNS